MTTPLRPEHADTVTVVTRAQEGPPLFGPKYQARIKGRGATGQECAACGKPATGGLLVRMSTNGLALSVDAPEDGEDMGYYPIGADCARAYAGYVAR